MKYFLYFGLTVLTLFVIKFVYLAYLRPVDPVQPEIYELAEHFKKNGIKVGIPYPVRHGYSHSQVIAVAALPILDFPLPITITSCPNNNAAHQEFLSANSSPGFTHTTINGQHIMVLPMWGDNTNELAEKIVQAFSNFKISNEVH